MPVTTFRRLCLALLTTALLLPASAAADGVEIISSDTRQIDAGAAPGGGARTAATRKITPCTWSYFGDPRSIAHGDWVHTGCIGTDGKAKLDQFNVATGEHRLLTLFRGLEVDDHNNPSLIFFRKKMYAFASKTQRSRPVFASSAIKRDESEVPAYTTPSRTAGVVLTHDLLVG